MFYPLISMANFETMHGKSEVLSSEEIFFQPSWVLRSSTVSMAITEVGAHMAPVFFASADASSIQPYHISPWQNEPNAVPPGSPDTVLRGDFFCLPFGHSKTGPIHGRTSAFPWRLVHAATQGRVHELALEMPDAGESARVIRNYYLVNGQNVIYDRTTISGLTGSHPFGHHAVLRLPRQRNTLLVSTSPIQFGMTAPHLIGDPEKGEYQSLAIGAQFNQLSQVPSIFKDTPDSDCSAYPSRPGFCDLLQIAVAPPEGEPAWNAAVNTEENYLWFSLRDSSLLPSTIFWIENKGRHSAPWNGRNCSLGLEDVCSFFDSGNVESEKPNSFSERGIKTAHSFQPKQPFHVPYIQGAVSVPAGFGRVESFECADDSIRFADTAGREVKVPVQSTFLFGEELS